MANDREILREIWEGKIPVHFKLSGDETDVEPEEYFLLIPRLSYFPLVTDKVRKHFLRFVSNELQDGEMWLDSNGTPLKWHFPIGVLYDLLVGTDGTLPWHVTVHFSKFPDDILIRCPNKEIVEAHFMSSLKEADVLKHRGQVVSAMQKKDHNQLWLGLVNDKFDQFWAVNRRLMEPIPDQDGFKHIPVRCYAEDGTYQQKLVAPSTASGQKRLLQDLLDDFSTPVRKADLPLSNINLEHGSSVCLVPWFHQPDRCRKNPSTTVGGKLPGAKQRINLTLKSVKGFMHMRIQRDDDSGQFCQPISSHCADPLSQP